MTKASTPLGPTELQTPEAAPRPARPSKQRSLNKLQWLRKAIVRTKWWYFTRVWGMDIDPTATFSLSVRFDKTYPAGVHVGPWTYIAFETAILAHDMTRGLYLHTRIGKDCFIGARSVILPGITIGDESIVGAGSIVTKDVPPRCIVAGNPAQIVRRDIQVGHYGQFLTAEGTKARLAAAGAFD
jgi:acetyltransferase-like isoleucine patch superfamily enzyme